VSPTATREVKDGVFLHVTMSTVVDTSQPYNSADEHMNIRLSE